MIDNQQDDEEEEYNLTNKKVNIFVSDTDNDWEDPEGDIAMQDIYDQDEDD